MGNSKYTLTDCAQAMRARKYQEEARMRKEQQLDDGDEIENAADAWYAATVEFERMVERGEVPGYLPVASRIAAVITTTASKPKAPESEVAPRKPCTEHRVKSFTFKDGTTWESCTADDCMYGKGRNVHSDGTGLDEVLDEVLDDVVEELRLEPVEQAPVAGQDDDVDSSVFADGEESDKLVEEEYEEAFDRD